MKKKLASSYNQLSVLVFSVQPAARRDTWPLTNAGENVSFRLARDKNSRLFPLYTISNSSPS